MNAKNIAITAIAALFVLAGCSKPSEPLPSPLPRPSDSEEVANAPAAPPAQADQAATVEMVPNRQDKAAGMLSLIDTAPNCQSFRDQFDAAAKAPGPATLDDLSKIVAAAHDAGCGRKSGTP